MKEPVWVDKSDALAFHLQLLARFGGPEGMRDDGLLEPALARPRHLLSCGGTNLFAMAAAYAHGIVKNHPFLDGNKRSGFMAAALFLEINGMNFRASEEHAVLFTVGLASGEISEEEYAAWLKDSCSPES